MYSKLITAALLALAFSAPVQAQVFKCKTADGKTEYKDYPCEGKGVKTEEVRMVREITPEEFAAAASVHQSNKNQAAQKESENTQRPRPVSVAGKTSDQSGTVETYHVKPRDIWRGKF